MNHIDLNNWPRRQHYEFFKNFERPQLSITANIDVTKIHSLVKHHNLSYYNTLIYFVSKTANLIPEFRYRITEDSVVEHNLVHPSYTFMGKGELYNFCTTDFTENSKIFLERMQTTIEFNKNNSKFGEEVYDRTDLIYISCVPLVSFTSITNPYLKPANDSIPRIVWGKYYKDSDKLLMPLSLEVHHALIDGIHVGKFYETLQQLLNDCENNLNL